MSQAKSISAVLMLAVCGLLSCGGGEVPANPKELVTEGHMAQSARDSKAAEAKFQQALASLKPGDALYVEARLGLVEALIATDAKRATNELWELDKACPGRVGEKELSYVCLQLMDAKKCMEALELVRQGTERAGGNAPSLKVHLARLRDEALHDQELYDRLKALGYAK